MDEIKDLVVFEFSGQKVKTIIKGLAWADRALKADEYYAEGYTSVELKNASTVKIGDSTQSVKDLKRAQG